VWPASAPSVWPKGYLAVDFFMMLSGYVMARTYETRMQSGLGPLAFFRIRYKRMWLTMLIAGLIGVPYLWHIAPDGTRFTISLLANLALIPAPLNRELFPLNGPTWSIFFELIANVIHAAVLWRLASRQLVLVGAVLLGLLGVMVSINGTVDFGAIDSHWYPAFFRALVPYIGGILLWRHWQDRPTIGVPPVLPYLALPLIFAAAPSATHWLYDLVFVVAVCPLLMAGGLRLTGEHSWARWLGMISFPLYALNVPVLHNARLLGIGPLAGIAATLTGTVALTWWLSAREVRAKAARTP
jgi:peptidoglycan/LPS O-acetylase OafA/YrhL